MTSAFWLSMIVFGTVPLLALDPSVAISQYAKKHWQVEDGLPQNYVTSITQAPDGCLLVGTSGGAARFDGVRFTPLVLNPATGISREWINVLRATADGSVWIASRDAGLYLFQGGPSASPMHWDHRFSTLLPTSRGTMLALGFGDFWAWDRSGVVKIAPKAGVPDPSWQTAAELPGGGIFALTVDGPRVLKDGRVTPVAPAYQGTGLAVRQGRGGDLWVGTTNGLYRGNRRVTGVPGPVVSIVEDRHGVVWAGTWGQGLYRIIGNGVAKWTAGDGLPDNFVHDLFEDSEGNLWIGSRAGLSRWKSTPVIPYGPAEGLAGQYFSAITGTPDGDIWLGTWRSGLYHFSRGRAREVELPEPRLSVVVGALAAAPGGALWMSGWRTGLFEKQPCGWKSYSAADLGYPPLVHAIAFDPRGGLWLGADSGLYHYPGGRPVRGAAALASGPVEALLIDRRGRCWAGTANGLVVLEQGRTRPIGGLPHPGVTSLAEDGAGAVWVTTRANGLSRITPAGLRVFDARHGLPELPFYAVLDDGLGSLWLSSPSGIYAVPAAQFEEVAAGRRARLDPVAFTQDDGLRSNECQNVGQPRAWKDRQGSLWFPTVRGVVQVQPHRREAAPPPRVLVESVASAARSHVVRFTAPRLASPQRLEFRYRVESIDLDWIAAGSERMLRYNNLPAGHHRLSIAAREQGGKWGPPTVLQLEQPPRFHETWWFRVLFGTAAAALLYAVYRWRILLLRGRYRAVLAERNRIAREWHDTLLAGFSAIGWQLDATRQRLLDKPQSAEASIEVARAMLQHYRAEARRVIWDLRGSEPELRSLDSEVRSAVAELTRERSIATSVEVEGEPVALPRAMAQNLLRICQEATSNAVRHGSPSRIEVRIRFGEARVEAAVRDDGGGFDPAAVPDGHFGLQIIRERARHFGGEVAISSRTGAGTTVTAVLPYSPGKQ